MVLGVLFVGVRPDAVSVRGGVVRAFMGWVASGGALFRCSLCGRIWV